MQLVRYVCGALMQLVRDVCGVLRAYAVVILAAAPVHAFSLVG